MAMVCNMLVAATAGTLVPLGLKALKIDPALASSVFITTFTDVVGLRLVPGLRDDLHVSAPICVTEARR